jgi:hypothetical protein
MLAIILLVLILPFAAAAVSLRAPDRVAGAVTAVTGVACFGLVLALVPAAAHRDLDYLSYLRIDAVSVVFLMARSRCTRSATWRRAGAAATRASPGTPGASTPG